MQNRRPLNSRKSTFFQNLAHYLAKNQVFSPNQISVLSIVFALIGAGILAYSHQPLALICCAICIQLRLVCNLLDGLVAVEGGLKTAVGDLYNEFPDRISDSFLLVALGYACDQLWLGWLSALLAMATAYIRVFGGSLTLPQSFSGPMAKQHRMAVMTLACICATMEQIFSSTTYSLWIALVMICIGSALTCVFRTKEIAHLLKQRGQ